MPEVKLIGLMTAWNEEPWVEYAIRNNLRLVDEMILAEGFSGPEYPARSTDKTRELMEKYRNHPKVTGLIDAIVKKKVSWGKVQTLTEMLALAKHNQVGNWVLLCAADALYDDAAMKEIREEIADSRNDEIYMFGIPTFNFAIDFQHYYHIKGGSNYLFRISPEMSFSSTENPRFKNGVLYKDSGGQKKTILVSHPIFHYMWLKPRNRLLQKLKMYGWQRSQTEMFAEWFSEFYLAWEDENAEEMYEKVKKITGHSGFHYWRKEKLEIFKGKHPVEVENHPYQGLDVRQIE